MRRDAKGELFVAGIRISGDKGDGKLTDWILSQSEIVMRGAEIEWLDESRKAPPLKLSALNFRLRTTATSTLSDSRRARRANWARAWKCARRWRAAASSSRRAGTAACTPNSATPTSPAGAPWVDYPLDVRRGEGALRLWATLAGGRISQATADVALSNVSARLGKDLPVLEVSAVRGRVYGRETARGYDFGVRNLALASPGAPADERHQFSRHAGQPASGTSRSRSAARSAPT